MHEGLPEIQVDSYDIDLSEKLVIQPYQYRDVLEENHANLDDLEAKLDKV